MQVIYFRDMLIPSDPIEQYICSDGPLPSTTSTSSGKSTSGGGQVNAPTTLISDSLKRNLEDFYKDWKKDLEDRKKESNTVKTLCETLSQGLYQQSPHVVFKVIGEIRMDLV